MFNDISIPLEDLAPSAKSAFSAFNRVFKGKNSVIEDKRLCSSVAHTLYIKNVDITWDLIFDYLLKSTSG